MLTLPEIMETINMIQEESLDIRTITMGISLRSCAHPEPERAQELIYDTVTARGEKLVEVGQEIEATYGIPIVNKRISVTPISLIAEAASADDYTGYARALDRAASNVGVNFVGGFSALVEKGMSSGDCRLLASIPRALSETSLVCSSVNVASTRAGINMEAVGLLGGIIRDTANLTAQQNGMGCAKLAVFANVPGDNPFMAGAFHGVGEPEVVINVGVSGPGVVKKAVEGAGAADLGELAEVIKKTAFKITRMGELVGRVAAQRLGVAFGIVDLSLAPTPAVGDSVARVLESMGLEVCGTHGTTAALALLNDAVKKGGAMASSSVGGLSGAFIPVSEDAGMVNAVKAGALSLDKLEAMTSVCSVGLDMIAVPGDTPRETLSAIIADEAAIGVTNNKTTGVRIIPVPGKKVGEEVVFGGLLGETVIMPVKEFSSAGFIKRGGRIPAPVHSLRN